MELVFFVCFLYDLLLFFFVLVFFKKAREPGRVVFPIPILPRHHPPSMEKIINVRKISN